MQQLVTQMGEMNSAQLNRMVELLDSIAKQKPPTVNISTDKPKGCTLKIHRDGRGFISTIDVEPK